MVTPICHVWPDAVPLTKKVERMNAMLAQTSDLILIPNTSGSVLAMEGLRTLRRI
jgi:hypothetical protein